MALTSDDLDLDLPVGPGPDPLPPQFTPEAWIKLAEAGFADAVARGVLEQKLGNFEEIHRGEPFVWID